MEKLNYIIGMFYVLVCLYSAKMLVLLTGLNIPAPLVGLILLFLLLKGRILAPHKLALTCQSLIAYMALFFIPVGVGFIEHLQLVAKHKLLIISLLFLLPCLVLFSVGKLATKGKYRD
ncbi:MULTISPECIES: CidA/LrgA family protein [Pseudoalteromonas]|uniref:Putative effector of murein hydrolase LrgA n=1 Tax=Pseudoalteromonas luteoviolacea (strain 2ta16) TaxID=1353533 RepID=V4H8T7_PSEL2|nr:CidA/LrgA family protein [Pseudoalteromonas luteoviolacea]ESP93861.1 putative effector of murein hydrolase LrgA [Pseudoalteromonas luteoviolacea 2ta16]KZN31294.1 hypothetical protein N483_05590 [Pseudoalteromonas luteoviolacea NCIMB 1944]MCG7548288.1 CidA/LrgA family protein [Pseudoalteromonas sp. Of7M-16]